MIANLDTRELTALLKDFHMLTGIRLAVFDADYTEIAAYPESHCAYCNLFQSDPVCHKKCMESNRQSFRHCQKTSKLIVYHCHAGLVEATAPLIDNGVLLGYIMFGQISDLENTEELKIMVQERLAANGLPAANEFPTPNGLPAAQPSSPDEALLTSIVRKSTEQIHAAAKILEACTFYVMLKHLMSARRQNFRTNLDQVLMEHIREEITSDRLARFLGISRSKLYESCSKYLGCGIAHYLKHFRLEQAKKLLKETDLSVSDISEQVGFNDYNYFCRVFKAYAGMSARKFRGMYRE